MISNPANFTEMDWRYSHDPGDNQTATITMPRAARAEGERRGIDWVLVPGHVAHVLTQVPPEVMQAYYTLAAWKAAGTEISPERFLAEVCGSDDERDAWALDALIQMKLVITPDEAKERARDFAEAMYGSRSLPGDYEDGVADGLPRRKRKPKVKRVVPAPFPEFLPETWSGTRDDLAESSPRPKVNVVYYLYDEDDTLIYVGSTGNVYGRLSYHPIREWVRYEAHRCGDRDAAYWLEAVEIMERRPPMNRTESVGGRINALSKLRLTTVA